MTIYKILLPAEYDVLVAAEEFEGSPLDLGDGYVHLSTEEQLPRTLGKFFAGAGEVVVASVDEGRFGEELKWENGFPHLYRPLPMDAVQEVRRVMAP